MQRKTIHVDLCNTVTLEIARWYAIGLLDLIEKVTRWSVLEEVEHRRETVPSMFPIPGVVGLETGVELLEEQTVGVLLPDPSHVVADPHIRIVQSRSRRQDQLRWRTFPIFLIMWQSGDRRQDKVLTELVAAPSILHRLSRDAQSTEHTL